MVAHENKLRSALQNSYKLTSPLRRPKGTVPFLRAVSDSLERELAALEPDGRIIFATREIRSFTEGDAALCEGAENGYFIDYIDRMRSAKEPLPEAEFELSLPEPGGSEPRDLHVEVKPVWEEDGEHSGYLLVACGSPYRRGRAAMQDADRCDESTLVRQEKLVALGTIAAGIAHEIGNPLASLSAVVQLLKRKVQSGEIADHLDTLQEQIERIARIVRQMLSFSRPSAQKRTPTDVNQLIEKTVTMVGYSQQGREVDIRVDQGATLPKLRIMPQLFQQVLVNLLLNAADAVEEKEQQGVIEVCREVRKGWACISVQDNGRGMTEEEKERALDPFYTTKPAGEGTGLGLAVSYRLVQREGGDIGIESTPGEGTRVTVYLPLERTCGDE